ncbi:WXG100 family type VII secretion target [Actinoalloteichus caeruleus]|uniref:Outer membrane channel protein CpnT-like N-terminal domain-containing protein n=1 Tax=Actinoalloteichus caeruleus DSM 43889 TaxID=1120930 RepID=A0ABT1JLT4_ACTCY|nr:hypothetical protein [Actinoalloteichus caeruleus]MCP2332696.1 hypothetical protein [Actinoalloteichus caeruleus DSM 43889]
MTGPPSFEELNENADQRGWFGQAAARGSSWSGAYQDLQDATTPPEITAATITGRLELLEAIRSPGQALVGNGLGFLVSIVLSPLVEIAEWAIGDPEQMRATGEGWEQVARWLDEVSEAEGRRAEATEDSWRGEAGDAFRSRFAEFAEGVAALAADIRDLRQVLDLVADLFDAFVEFTIQLITELVIGLIVSWLAALAAAWITAGASVAAANVTTTIQVGSTGIRLTMRVTRLQQRIGQLVRRLEALLTRLRGPFRDLVNQAGSLRSGNAAQRFAMRRVDGNPLVNIFTRADGSTLASTTGNRFSAGVEGTQALATNISEAVLRNALGGQSRTSGAAMAAAGDQLTSAAIEQGAELAHDAATPEPSAEERRAAQERGFQW